LILTTVAADAGIAGYAIFSEAWADADADAETDAAASKR